jgi:hypothetical protein
MPKTAPQLKSHPFVGQGKEALVMWLIIALETNDKKLVIEK